MLPSGWFSRLAVAAVLFLMLLLVLDLLFFHSFLPSPLFSDSLDLAIVILAAACSFQAARRSSSYPRQIWLLLTVALTLEALGQGISTYYQSFVPGSAQSPWPSDVLFFVWAAPIFMILLPGSDEDSSTIDSARLLDFLQIAILAVALYLYFFYSPSRWQSSQPLLLRQILYVYAARDLLLSLAFFLRSRSSIPSWFRSFCLILAGAFFVLVLADLEYLLALVNSRISTDWGDLIWMGPCLLVILFASRWTQPFHTPLPARSSRLSTLLNAQFLPVAIPLLVIFMGRAIAREHVLIAWIAVAASVLVSSIRLILTNRRQRRISDSLLATERALRSSEEILSTAFRNSPDAFSINPFPNGPYLEVNDGYTRLTGYTREEVLGKTPRQMNLWVDFERRDLVLAALQKSGHVRDFEFRFRTKSGAIRIGQMSASIIELRNQPCALVIVRDITERKEAEEILRSSEQRFRSLVQNLHVGIITVNPHAQITFANQSALDLLGLTLDQSVGKSADDLGLVALAEDGTPLAKALRPIPLVLTSRTPLRGRYLGWRLPSRPEPVWTILDAFPEFNSAGDISRVVVSFTDITEHRRDSEALRESEERFRTLVQTLNVAVVLHRPDGRVEYANPAAYHMFSVPEGTAVGKVLSDLGITPIHEDGKEIPQQTRPIATVIRTGAPVETGVIGLRFTVASVEKTLWVFGNALPQFDAKGNLLRIITSFADVTEMKNAERAIHNLSTQLLKLQDAERRRIGRELHDGLAQTVLAINLSLAQARQSLTSKESSATRAIDKARDLTQQMSREIRTLSYLLHPPLLDDLGLVSTLKEYVQGFGERSGIHAELFADADLERFPQPIEIALFRVVQESLANIQRHSGSATAQIRLTQRDSLLTLEIIDHGRGIPSLSRPQNGEPTLTDPLPQAACPEPRRACPEQGRRVRPEAFSSIHPDQLPVFPNKNNSVIPFTLSPEGPAPSTGEGLALSSEGFTLSPEGPAPSAGEGLALSSVEGNGVLAGRGPSSLDPPPAPSPSHNGSSPRLGVGIPGMRERMTQLGGRLDIISGPTGTTIRATIALPFAAQTETLDGHSTHPDRG